jgi:hypothetical protein
MLDSSTADSVHIVCPHRETVNRISTARRDAAPGRGQCHDIMGAKATIKPLARGLGNVHSFREYSD